MNNTSSSANETMIFELYQSTAAIIGYALAYGILGLLGLVGNIMVLMVVFMNKSMRTTTNILLVNLSSSDIVYTLLGMPGYMITDICNQRWILGRAMIMICHGVSMLSIAASALTLIAIAFERYLAIVYPLKDRVRNKNKARFWMLFTIWVFSVAIASPYFITSTTKTVPLHVRENGKITLRNIKFVDVEMNVLEWRVYYMIMFVCLHVFPFVSLGILYSGIARSIRKPDKRLNETEPVGEARNQTVSGMSERNRRKTTLMVIAILVGFFICYFPFHLLYIINMLFKDVENHRVIIVSSLRIVISLNTALNPIIYSLLSKRFRDKFRAILSCCQHKKHNGRGISTTRARIIPV
ncbi:octopamine receptor 1-like [Dendronephthya gigantea]|uniref:octopamine receptor 1-like n=1 Tax=Dendronephthya gigantea TaxID=151771 RepID=UPI00106B8B73|nr:octopamine receptor 1-like [Dendronephthya gigantea]